MCPACGSIAIARILYGYPGFDADLRAEVDAGWAVLGGCIVGRDPADRRCRACGTRFRADGQPVGVPGGDR